MTAYYGRILLSALDEEYISESIEQNANFHVWLYWREHLSPKCERLRLQRLLAHAAQFLQVQEQTNKE